MIIGDILTDFLKTKSTKEYHIPYNVTKIADCAFYDCRLSKVVFPKSVRSIGHSAFFNCSNLNTIVFKSTIPPKIKDNAFAYCANYTIQVPDLSLTQYKEALKIVGKNACIISETEAKTFKDDIAYNLKYDNYLTDDQLVSFGIRFEKEGNRNAAYSIYERVIQRGYTESYPYDSLICRYKLLKDTKNEIRIIRLAIRVGLNYKYGRRLNQLLAKDKPVILPTYSKTLDISNKRGDQFEEIILNIPEFNFYTTTPDYEQGDSSFKPMWETLRYFKELRDLADIEVSKKNLKVAAEILETIVYENYWMPAPYDKLISIYSRSKLYSDEIRILEHAIKHFSELKQRRLSYVTKLAEKYGATDFLNKRLSSGGKISYYAGIFELYNPFPIIERWKERLLKKIELLKTLNQEQKA